jgi:hypothetical protein
MGVVRVLNKMGKNIIQHSFIRYPDTFAIITVFYSVPCRKNNEKQYFFIC